MTTIDDKHALSRIIQHVAFEHAPVTLADWIYDSPSLEALIGTNDYVVLISLNLNQSDAAEIVLQLLSRHVSAADLRRARVDRVIDLLRLAANAEHGTLNELLLKTSSRDMEYDFMGSLKSYRFAVSSIHGKGESAAERERDERALFASHKEMLKSEAIAALEAIQAGRLSLTGEKDSFGYPQYEWAKAAVVPSRPIRVELSREQAGWFYRSESRLLLQRHLQRTGVAFEAGDGFDGLFTAVDERFLMKKSAMLSAVRRLKELPPMQSLANTEYAETFAELVWDTTACETIVDADGNAVGFTHGGDQGVMDVLEPIADLVQDGSYFILFWDDGHYSKYEFSHGGLSVKRSIAGYDAVLDELDALED